MGGSLPFRSGVVVSLRPLSVCQGSWWLVPALFPALSLSLPVSIFSWLLLTPGPSECVARWSSLCPSPSVHLSSLQGSSLSLVRVQCYLPDLCLGSGVVFRTLPSFLPAWVGASVGSSALRPAAASALFPGVPL